MHVIEQGPWKSVQTTVDPGDDGPNVLQDATNCYIPDPTGGSGLYALPGWTLENGGNAIVTSATAFRGQGAFSHTDLGGNTFNFEVWNGKLIRVNASRTTFTDVTPTTIDNAVTTRVYGTSFIGQLVVTDGVHRPWVASNLSSTPITATAIDFDGAATAWAAWGPGVVYTGALVFILRSVGGVACQTDIAWSVPADPTTGWQQPNYDFRWTLEQSVNQASLTNLYGLAAENTQLYYWRENAIGSLSGVPGPNFQGQATHDAISKNVGTLSPQSIILFGDNIFFADQTGRPYMLQQGYRILTPLWLNMREIVDASTYGFPGVTMSVCTAGFESNLNLYIIAPWSSQPSQNGPATQGYIFDARTGAYSGRMQIGAGMQIDSFGAFVDASGRAVLVAQGSAVVPSNSQVAPSGFMWTMNSLAGSGSNRTTEGAALRVTEGGVQRTTEGTTVNWTDNGVAKVISATTNRLGYNVNAVLNVDRVSALVGSTAPCTVSLETASVAQTVEGTPTPSTVQDGVSKIVVGASGVQGRGVIVTISPTTSASQWVLHGLAATVVESVAGPEEP